jgi:hypothetical protein
MGDEVSKLNIVDLTNEVELSSAAMSKIGGGISCQAGVAVASVYLLTSQILGALGDSVGQANFAGKSVGVLQGACPA